MVMKVGAPLPADDAGIPERQMHSVVHELIVKEPEPDARHDARRVKPIPHDNQH